jgi:hypothetical protein
MNSLPKVRIAGFLGLFCLALPLAAAPPAEAPLPDLRQLMKEVEEHQKQVEKLRENYTFNASIIAQELDSKGRVIKTETTENEDFYVHGTLIARKVKKDGKPLDEQEQQKETERVTKFVEKAEKPKDEKKNEDELSLVRLLDVVEAQKPRRETLRGRPTIVCEFVGRKDAKAHGMSEDVFKKLSGKLWIDEADREVVRFEAVFNDNFHIGGGLLINIAKGSHLSFDQDKINGEIWLPVATEGVVDARLLLFKGMHAHIVEHDSNYQRFRVETQQINDTAAVPGKKP